jgi:trk system potassium uptake protein TrkH
VRGSAYLRQRYRAILSTTGFVLVLCAGMMLTPLLALLVWPAERGQAWAFVIPAAVAAAVGLAGWRLLRPRTDVAVTVQEGGVIVLLSWVLACLLAALPFMAVLGLNFTQAVFESVSGWTTTGLTVVDVTKASHVILLWRSILQFAGGAGLAILMLSTIIGPTGPAMGTAEGRDQLVPHVQQSAKLVMMIYSGYAVVGTAALRWAGMTWFDAINHCLPAISTGGFSTRVESIAYWDSAVIEAVIIVLMILGNLNFVTAYLLLRGKLRAVVNNGEVRLMAVLIPLSGVLVYLLTCRGLYPTVGKAVRVAVFDTISALTTTGFVAGPLGYSHWNGFGWWVLIVLMLIGGGTCSTAGGIKQYRIYLMYKSLIWEVRRWLLPRTAVTEHAVWEADRQVFITDARLRQIGTFIFLYLATYVVGSAILTAYGFGMKESLFEYASAVGDVGLSCGVTTPSAPAGALWDMTVGMFLGRLEFFVILAGTAKLAQDLRRMVS